MTSTSIEPENKTVIQLIQETLAQLHELQKQPRTGTDQALTEEALLIQNVYRLIHVLSTYVENCVSEDPREKKSDILKRFLSSDCNVVYLRTKLDDKIYLTSTIDSQVVKNIFELINSFPVGNQDYVANITELLLNYILFCTLQDLVELHETLSKLFSFITRNITAGISAGIVTQTTVIFHDFMTNRWYDIFPSIKLIRQRFKETLQSVYIMEDSELSLLICLTILHSDLKNGNFNVVFFTNVLKRSLEMLHLSSFKNPNLYLHNFVLYSLCSIILDFIFMFSTPNLYILKQYFTKGEVQRNFVYYYVLRLLEVHSDTRVSTSTDITLEMVCKIIKNNHMRLLKEDKCLWHVSNIIGNSPFIEYKYGEVSFYILIKDRFNEDLFEKHLKNLFMMNNELKTESSSDIEWSLNSGLEIIMVTDVNSILNPEPRSL